MVLPRSAVIGAGSMPFRSIEPLQWVETVLLVPPRTAGSAAVKELAVRLSEALDPD